MAKINIPQITSILVYDLRKGEDDLIVHGSPLKYFCHNNRLCIWIRTGYYVVIHFKAPVEVLEKEE